MHMGIRGHIVQHASLEGLGWRIPYGDNDRNTMPDIIFCGAWVSVVSKNQAVTANIRNLLYLKSKAAFSSRERAAFYMFAVYMERCVS
jgi:hypothetical protein